MPLEQGEGLFEAHHSEEPAITRADGRVPLPAGTVTLLLGDVESSVRLWEADREAMTAGARRLDDHVSDLAAEHRGARPLEQGEGDSFVLAFARASDAVACALALQRAIDDEPWPGGLEIRVRMALHTGDVRLRDDENYAGPAINRCARIRALAHGGQTLLSRATHDVVVDDLAPDVDVRDLGEHRLRDLARPERVYQLCSPGLADSFPPLRSLDTLPTNLPQQLTSFIGRDREMTEIRRLLAASRMVTLIGAGGCGKTRLALQAAAELFEDFPDGVWWIDLAPVADPMLVPSVVASAVSVQETPTENVAETLARKLRERRLLLLFDNCEHLVDACAAISTALLRACPAVRLLATSREPLGIEGETTLRVPSLPVPPLDGQGPEGAVASDAVRLFADRAARVRPNFRITEEIAPAVVEICRRLDGIPLAIELAAARTRSMSPAQIEAGLSDRFHLLTGGARTALPRQRTLEASVDWSYTLLTDRERTLFARLSVFAGSFSLEAAEDVCSGEDVDRYAVLDLLSSVVDRSLVQVEETAGESRYRLLETIRAYARQKLADSPEAGEVRTRHLDHFVRLAERAESELRGAGFASWAERLTAELDNLRAAMEWALASGQAEKHLRLTASLLQFWIVRSLYSEVRRSMEAALSTATEPRVRAKALATASLVTLMAGRYRAAHALAAESVALAREAGDDLALQMGLTHVGWAGVGIGRDDRSDLDVAIALARGLGEPVGLIRSLMYRGYAEAMLGRPADARPFLDEAISLAETAGDHYFLSVALFFGSVAAFSAGALDQARRLVERSLASSRLLDNRTFLSFGLADLAIVVALQGDYDAAAAAIAEALAVAPEGTDQPKEQASGVGRFLQWASEDPETATDGLEHGLAYWRESGNAYWLNAYLWIGGALALARGDHEGARARLDEAVAFGRESGYWWHLGRALHQRARLGRVESDLERAEALAHEALQTLAGGGDRAGVCDVLENLGGLAVVRESHREAARLFGAAQALRDAAGYARFPIERVGYEADVAAARAGLGEDAFSEAWAEGAAMSLEEAVAYAERGRGERKRPGAGWAALTPAELDVVRLVAQGLTNPDIAKKLFIARNTVKVHLQHVFAKLGVSTRAELAAEATRRGF